jgi:hypothetical protein
MQPEMLALFVETLVSHLDRNLSVIVERDTNADGRLGNSKLMIMLDYLAARYVTRLVA